MKYAHACLEYEYAYIKYVYAYTPKNTVLKQAISNSQNKT